MEFKLRPLTFAMQKAFAWAEGRWLNCPHSECKRRKRCCGGPRGTERRQGKPLCCEAQVAAAIEARRVKRVKARIMREKTPPW